MLSHCLSSYLLNAVLVTHNFFTLALVNPINNAPKPSVAAAEDGSLRQRRALFPILTARGSPEVLRDLSTLDKTSPPAASGTLAAL